MTERPPETKPPVVRVSSQRPKTLSDPYRDFNDAMLHNLLATSDEELTLSDYQNLLGPHLPAGTYEESVYFLPLACNYVWAHPNDAFDMNDAIIGFASKNFDRLSQDGMGKPMRQWLGAWLRSLTSGFLVIHFNKEACARKGWGSEYGDIVEDSEAVCDILQHLVTFVIFADLADEFVAELAMPDAPNAAAAWFLELSRARREAVRKPPETQRIVRLLTDRRVLLEKKAQVLHEQFAAHDSSTYWPDTFAALRI